MQEELEDKKQLMAVIYEYTIQDKDHFPDHKIEYLREICRYTVHIDRLPEEDYTSQIVSLARLLQFVGDITSFAEGESKRAYNRRKLEFAKAKLAAKKYKEESAEIAVEEYRDKEAYWKECSRRWDLAHTYIECLHHALKYKQKVQFADGSVQAY